MIVSGMTWLIVRVREFCGFDEHNTTGQCMFEMYIGGQCVGKSDIESRDVCVSAIEPARVRVRAL